MPRYLPDRSAEVWFPFPVDGLERPVQVRLQLDQFHYLDEQMLAAVLMVSQDETLSIEDARLQIRTHDGPVLHEVRPQGDKPGEWTAIIDLATPRLA